MGRRLATVPLYLALVAGHGITTAEAPETGYAQAGQENLAKLLESYKCEPPIFFDAGGRYVGAVVRDTKIRIRTFDFWNSKAKAQFLDKPDSEKKKEQDVSRYLFEISTKGEAPYGTSQLDGFREDKYIGGEGVKTATESQSGKNAIDLFKEFYPSIKAVIEKCPKKQ